MTEESEVISDPDNYAAMQVPHESADTAVVAYREFWRAVYELRKQHRIPDVFMVCRLLFKEGGKTCGTVAVGHMGSNEMSAELAAIGFRDEKQRMCERLDKLATVDREKSENGE